jgi:hypothetical protein
MLTVTAHDAETRGQLSPAAIRGFIKLGGLWNLSTEDQLAMLGASVSRTTLFEWKRADPPRGVLNEDQLMRISLLLGIYEGLQRIWGRNPREADAWVTRPNAGYPFFGKTPLAYMREGGIPAMVMTRAYIDDATGSPPGREWSAAHARAG